MHLPLVPRFRPEITVDTGGMGVGLRKFLFDFDSPQAVNRERQRHSMQRSTQSLNEVFGPQMGVTLKHPKFLVPADCRDLGDVEALLEKAADALMA